jgi:hypothetical protein
VHARKTDGAPVLPELRLQVVDRNFAFRDCNYSLYPSWLAYPWAHAHLLIRGNRPYGVERRDRGIPGSEAGLPDPAAQNREAPDGAAVFAALLDFARNSPRPARLRLNLNTGAAPRKVSGLLGVLGCRLASVGRNGELAILGGVEFEPALGSEPGGPARTDGLRVRHRILIQPGTTVRFALPLHLARAAQARPRPGQQVEAIEPLPSVFTDSSSFRSLWPEGPPPRLNRRYRIDFSATGATPVPLPDAEEPAPAEEAAAAP